MNPLLCLTLFISILVQGCVAHTKPEMWSEGDAKEKLNNAVTLQTQGQTVQATKAMESVIAAKPVTGITDEALFRLAMLYLNEGSNKNGYSNAHSLLERLKREFPASAWTKLSAPLLELLTSHEELLRQYRSIKSQNQTIQRENKELHHSIDRLKKLDIELERKKRR